MTAAAEAKMTTYVAVAKANQAWLAWRRGAIAEAQQLGEAALELWLQFPTPFPYQWLAVWPLIGIANMFDLDAEVIEHIKALFGPGQYLPRQPLARHRPDLGPDRRSRGEVGIFSGPGEEVVQRR